MKNQIKTFKGAIEYLNTIPYINSGGCAVAALSLYRVLQKQGKSTDNTQIYFFYEDEDDELKDYNERFLYNGEKSVYYNTCSHALLKHRGKFIYIGGKYNLNKFKDKHIFYEYEIETLVARAVRFKRNWNSTFNRKYIKSIENNLGIKLKNEKSNNFKRN